MTTDETQQSPAPVHTGSRPAPQDSTKLAPGQHIPEPHDPSKVVVPAAIAEEAAAQNTPAEIASEDELRWEDYENRIFTRKFDSEDMVRMKSQCVKTETGEDGQTIIRADTGMLQKLTIVLGIEKCPWFSDVVHQRTGVTKTIYHKRMEEEFRNVPVEFLDKLFRVAQEANQKNFERATLQKKS